MAKVNQNIFLITDPLMQSDVVDVLPDGVTMIDLDDIPYRAEPMVHCAFCKQRQLHRDGYFAILSSGQRALCGNCCAAAFDNTKKITIDRKRNQLKRERDARGRSRLLAEGLGEMLPVLSSAERAMTETAEAVLVLRGVFSLDAQSDMETHGIQGVSFLLSCRAHLTLAETTIRNFLELDSITKKELEAYSEKKKIVVDQVRKAAKYVLACDEFFDPVNLKLISEWAKSRGHQFGVKDFKVKGGTIRPKGPGMWRNFSIPTVGLEDDVRVIAQKLRQG